ncbi:MAG: type II toxin-antitoxin system HipA family toxin [Desulforhopalus sp.]
MVDGVEVAYVKIWDQVVGAVTWNDKSFSTFEFDKNFLRKGLDLSPIHMPLAGALRGDAIYSFRSRSTIGFDTFKGLPGMLADSLPDRFGNAIIDSWLQRQKRDIASFSPVERLCFIGSRGMGALEYVPCLNVKLNEPVPVEIEKLVELAHEVITERSRLNFDVTGDDSKNSESLAEILNVGTSAGGARAKAVIAISEGGDIISGHLDLPSGYEHWLIKFDGVADIEPGVPQRDGRIEYGYHLMAKEAGIVMPTCKILEENGRAHFLVKRFDRLPDNQKVHMQSLCGLAHYDFNMLGAYGYEQVFGVMRKLRIPASEAEQLYRRMVFNVVASNQDDHTKNITFLMDKCGKWSLSPAYDVTYSHNPGGKWTSSHQMTINGKRGNFTREDLMTVGRSINLKKPGHIIDEIIKIVRKWPEFAQKAGVSLKTGQVIAQVQQRAVNAF